MSKNILKIAIIFVIGMLGGIFANQIFWPYFVEKPFFYQYQLDQRPIYMTERKEIYIQENIALQEAIEKVKKSVVGVRTETQAGQVLEGSGLIVTFDGLMVTLAELVPFGSQFNFFINNERVSYEVLERDLEANLALIKLEQNNLATVSFADSEETKLGQRVFLIGKVFTDKGIQAAVNEGIVKTFTEDLIETNIIESKAFSGSVLFDIEGNVFGLSFIDREGKVFAVPVSKIKSFSGF